MSLNDAERRRTSDELKSNFALSGLTSTEVAADLQFTPKRLQSTLEATGDPVDVWELRDYLEHAAKDAGEQPIPYSVLTEQSRLLARRWFRLREPRLPHALK